MTWPNLLVLVRHAESDGNVRSVDERASFETATHAYNLTPRGRKQAEITGAYLAQKFPHFDVRYVSYYQRSRETMEVMCPKQRVYEDPRLAEGQRGIWHTMTREQMAARFPEEIARKTREGLYHYRPWGGENWADIELRIHSFLGTLARDYDNKNVLIVAHGHWMVLFQRLIEHFSIEEAIDRFHNRNAENASVTVYRGGLEDRARLVHNTAEDCVPWAGKL